MEPEVSLLCSQEATTKPYPEVGECTPYLSKTSFNIILKYTILYVRIYNLGKIINSHSQNVNVSYIQAANKVESKEEMSRSYSWNLALVFHFIMFIINFSNETNWKQRFAGAVQGFRKRMSVF
jgi:hypothetical protein